MSASVTWPQSNSFHVSHPEDKTEGKKTHKQAATEGDYSKGLGNHLMGGNWAFNVVHGF